LPGGFLGQWLGQGEIDFALVGSRGEVIAFALERHFGGHGGPNIVVNPTSATFLSISNGTWLQDVRQSVPQMLKASAKVKEAVDGEIQRRIKNKSS
jgi:hypothetical protein